MASPQVENGHTKIANEILDHLISIHLSPNQWQVLLCIIRKTYGFRKKTDYITNSQIIESTGLGKTVVSRALNELKLAKLITKNGKIIGLQKDWEVWTKLAESLTKVSNIVNSEKLAELSTLDIKLAELSTTKKLAEPLTELAKSLTKVSSPRDIQKKKETIQKKIIRKSQQEKLQEIFLTYSPDFIEAFNDYQEMRLKIKRPLTSRAIKMAVDRLKSLASSEKEQIAILNQSTFHSWQGLFALKQENKNNGHKEESRTIDEQLKSRNME